MLMQDGASEVAKPSTKVLETKVKLSPSTEPRNPTEEESRAPVAHTTSPLARCNLKDLTPLKIWPALLGCHFSVLPRLEIQPSALIRAPRVPSHFLALVQPGQTQGRDSWQSPWASFPSLGPQPHWHALCPAWLSPY